MQHGKGWLCKWGLAVLLVGSLLGSQHPHHGGTQVLDTARSHAGLSTVQCGDPSRWHCAGR